MKTLRRLFGPKGNPTAADLFNAIACLQEFVGVRLRVVVKRLLGGEALRI